MALPIRIENRLGPAIQQWKKQLTKTNFERFISAFCENLAKTLEALAFTRKYHQLGAILLDKVIQSNIILSHLGNKKCENFPSKPD